MKDLSFVPLREWGLPMGDIFLSAGPCSAESEKQVLDVTKGIADCGISFMQPKPYLRQNRTDFLSIC